MASKVTLQLVLRDINHDMVKAWNDPQAFGGDDYKDCVQISCGDIFHGAPSADSIVSPANSFGFMDGGIDYVYSDHFGWQMQRRLQQVLREQYDGELPVGCAVIIPAYPEDQEVNTSPDHNEGKPIRHLISAPTMRIPTNVSQTPNAYLAFRAVLQAVHSHNSANPDDVIERVLCPGLGTAVGRMPYLRCAMQMRTAFDAVILKNVNAINKPDSLGQCCDHHVYLIKDAGAHSPSAGFSSEGEPGELFVPA